MLGSTHWVHRLDKQINWHVPLRSLYDDWQAVQLDVLVDEQVRQLATEHVKQVPLAVGVCENGMAHVAHVEVPGKQVVQG